MRPLRTFWLFLLAIAVLQLLPAKALAQGAVPLGGAGARALGAGGAFVALANDVTAGYWNPAGLGEVTGPQLGGMYSVLSLNRQHNYAAAAYPLGPTGAMGISWIGYRFGKLGSDRNAMLFSYGNQLTETFALGGNVKLLCQNFAGASASGMGFDLGAKLKLSEVVTLGAGVQNLQPQVSWKIVGKGRKALPVNTRAGVNVKPLPFMNLVADFEFNDQQKGRWHAGWEIFLGDMFGLRAGSDDGAFTLGASLMRLAVGSNTLEMDYGFANDALDQSASHRLAFLLKFGNSGFGIAPLSEREKKAKQAAEETDYAKILAAREKDGLTVEKSVSGESAAAEPEVEMSNQSAFEQILADDESEETTAEPAPEGENATLPEVDLPAQNMIPEAERNGIALEQRREEAELSLDERIAAFEAQTNAGKRADAETVSDENVETALAPMTTDATEPTFEEKMAQLEAQKNSGESVDDGTVSNENVETTPARMTSDATELTFEEKMARFDAQANAGEGVNAETVSNENMETAPALMAADAAEPTFEEKMALLEAQTNAGEGVGAATGSDENVETTPAPIATDAAEPTFEARMALLETQASAGAETAANESIRTAPQNGMEVATPQITYGNKNGLTIPAIAPGKRLGHSLAALFQAQIIEARPGYWIINLGERAGFNANMIVEIYQPTPDGETGRAYGTAQPVDVRSLYSVIKITKRRSKHVPATGERVILKYFYPAVDY